MWPTSGQRAAEKATETWECTPGSKPAPSFCLEYSYTQVNRLELWRYLVTRRQIWCWTWSDVCTRPCCWHLWPVDWWPLQHCSLAPYTVWQLFVVSTFSRLMTPQPELLLCKNPGHGSLWGTGTIVAQLERGGTSSCLTALVWWVLYPARTGRIHQPINRDQEGPRQWLGTQKTKQKSTSWATPKFCSPIEAAALVC